MTLPELSWPQAATIILAGMPLVVFATAVLVAYPAVALSFAVTMVVVLWLRRTKSRRDALAARADLHHPALARLVAEPLPDMPTVPIRRSVR